MKQTRDKRLVAVFRRISFVCIVYGTFYSSVAFTMDRSHWYRATPVIPEPRLAKPGLATASVDVSSGHAHHGYNACGKKVPLFDIYGRHDFTRLATGLPLDLTDSDDNVLHALTLLHDSRSCPGSSIKGTFVCNELYLSYVHNYRSGFFSQIIAPFRELRVSRICVDNHCAPYLATSAWQNFSRQCARIMRKYGIAWESYHESHIGDTTVLFGWTMNYQDTDILDYIDCSITAGCLFPTGLVRSLKNPFAIPTGYDGHYALPVQCDFSFGLYEWLTLGCHADVLPFFGRKTCMRMKTDRTQSDIVLLGSGLAHRSMGPLMTTNMFVKADHVVRNFSCLLSYSCAHKWRDTVTPCDMTLFTRDIVNSNGQYASWTMHTINFLIEGDFSTEQCPVGPRISLFYNIPVAGKRIFRTSMGGVQVGLDITLCY